MSDALRAALEQHSKLLAENTAAMRELAASIASRRRRRAETEPELPEGHRFDTGRASLSTSAVTDLERIREALTYGWNGHAPPRPRDLPAIRFDHQRIAKLLAEGISRDEILDTVAGAAVMVASLRMEPDQWKATYLFGGFFDEVRVKIAEYRRGIAKLEAQLKSDSQPAPSLGAIDPSKLAEAAKRFAPKDADG